MHRANPRVDLHASGTGVARRRERVGAQLQPLRPVAVFTTLTLKIDKMVDRVRIMREAIAKKDRLSVLRIDPRSRIGPDVSGYAASHQTYRL